MSTTESKNPKPIAFQTTEEEVNKQLEKIKAEAEKNTETAADNDAIIKVCHNHRDNFILLTQSMVRSLNFLNNPQSKLSLPQEINTRELRKRLEAAIKRNGSIAKKAMQRAYDEVIQGAELRVEEEEAD